MRVHAAARSSVVTYRGPMVHPLVGHVVPKGITRRKKKQKMQFWKRVRNVQN